MTAPAHFADFANITAEIEEGVGVVRLNRPKALNALNSELIAELGQALDHFEADDSIGAIIITGSEKAFAAGADIKEMAEKTYMEAYKGDWLASWDRVTRCRKPVIAAVSGFALGGGCELAMMCDFIIAAENAKFGQPEVNLGVMPGAGGTQRLTRIVGKAKAMYLGLTARFMGAEEAERSGLVARVVPLESLMAEAMEAAKKIATLSKPIMMMTKEAVNAAYETTLSQGIMYERRLFHSMFATEDQKEGMKAFVEKRTPVFSDR